MSTSESDPRKYELKAEYRLGKGKDGVVDIKTWKREVKISSYKFFGKMALPIELEEYPDWAKPGEKKFTYTVNEPVLDSVTGKMVDNVITKPYPKPGDADYNDFKKKLDKFDGLVDRWEDKGPQVVGFLLDGTIDAPTRVRLLWMYSTVALAPILLRISRGILILSG